jgi:hypothetical protein
MELLNISISICGSEKVGKLALLLEGFTKQSQVDYVLEQLNKFMSDNAKQIKN